MKRLSEQLSEFQSILGATLRSALTTRACDTPILGAILGVTHEIGHKPNHPKFSERFFEDWGGPRAPEVTNFLKNWLFWKTTIARTLKNFRIYTLQPPLWGLRMILEVGPGKSSNKKKADWQAFANEGPFSELKVFSLQNKGNSQKSVIFAKLGGFVN